MGVGRGRKAANEAVFREVNEQIEEMQRSFLLRAEELLALVCECDRLSCTEEVRLTVREYERLRSDAACFVVVPGHEDAEVEQVVDTGPGYLIVRKRRGVARGLAEATDPRH